MKTTIDDLDDDVYGWTCPICGLSYEPECNRDDDDGENQYYLAEADEEDNAAGITGWYAICRSCMCRMEVGVK